MGRYRKSWALLAVAVMVWSGCGSDSDGDSAPRPGSADTTEASGTTDAQVDLDATVKVGYPAGVFNLDPHQSPNGTHNNYLNLFYDRLLLLDANGDVQPYLATAWEFSDDGATLTLTLRDDATFTDGTPIDAGAAKASLDRAMTLPESTAKTRLASIESIDAPDATTLVLHLNTPDVTLLRELGTFPGSVLNPAAISDGRDLAQGPNGAGSGIYDLVELVPNESVVAERAARKHWDPDASKVKRFEIQTVAPDPVLNAVLSGQLDVGFISGVDRENARRQAESVGDLTVHELKTNQVVYFLMRNTHPALTDVRVRQAIAHAVDRQTIGAQAMAAGHAATSQLVREGRPGFIEGELPLPHNPDRARTLLSQAGVTDLTLDLVTGNRPENQRGAEAIQRQLEEFGVNVNISVVPLNDAALQFREGTIPTFLGAFATEASPQQQLRSYLFTTLKLAGPDGAAVQPLLDRSLDATLSESEADKALQDVLDHVYEQAYMIPVSFSPNDWIASDRILNLDGLPWQFANGFDLRYLAVSN